MVIDFTNNDLQVDVLRLSQNCCNVAFISPQCEKRAHNSLQNESLD